MTLGQWKDFVNSFIIPQLYYGDATEGPAKCRFRHYVRISTKDAKFTEALLQAIPIYRKEFQQEQVSHLLDLGLSPKDVRELFTRPLKIGTGKLWAKKRKY